MSSENKKTQVMTRPDTWARPNVRLHPRVVRSNREAALLVQTRDVPAPAFITQSLRSPTGKARPVPKAALGVGQSWDPPVRCGVPYL